MDIFDIAIIGGGPAGLSAALNASVRNKSVLLISNNYRESGLYKAPHLDNVLGTPNISGRKYLEECIEQVKSLNATMIQGRVLNIMPTGDTFMIACGPDVYTARAVILASGVVWQNSYPGEKELLGRGVSYCATCDGMLYREKAVCVVAQNSEAVHEANYLREIGCQVTVISHGRDLSGLSDEIQVIKGRRISILGENQVEAVVVEDRPIVCQGVFILRTVVAMSSLLPGLNLEDGHIQVDRNMRTNISGIYAAGDCTGKPYQVAKASGEGLIAALAAAEFLDGKTVNNI